MRIFHREERRVRKWRKMIGAGGSDWKHYVRRKPHVVKRRVRKGIPDCLRGLVWQLISGSRDLLLMNPGVYEVILYINPVMIIEVRPRILDSWSLDIILEMTEWMGCIILVQFFHIKKKELNQKEKAHFDEQLV